MFPYCRTVSQDIKTGNVGTVLPSCRKEWTSSVPRHQTGMYSSDARLLSCSLSSRTSTDYGMYSSTHVLLFTCTCFCLTTSDWYVLVLPSCHAACTHVHQFTWFHLVTSSEPSCHAACPQTSVCRLVMFLQVSVIPPVHAGLSCMTSDWYGIRGSMLTRWECVVLCTATSQPMVSIFRGACVVAFGRTSLV